MGKRRKKKLSLKTLATIAMLFVFAVSELLVGLIGAFDTAGIAVPVAIGVIAAGAAKLWSIRHIIELALGVDIDGDGSVGPGRRNRSRPAPRPSARPADSSRLIQRVPVRGILAGLAFSLVLVACGGAPQLEGSTYVRLESLEFHGGYCFEGDAVLYPDGTVEGELDSTGQGEILLNTENCALGLCAPSQASVAVDHDDELGTSLEGCVSPIEGVVKPMCVGFP